MVTNEPAAMDLVFRALAHAARRKILDILRARPGAIVGEVAEEFDITRIAVMKHLAVLAEAGLVTSQRHGRERRLFLNPVPLQQVYERWVSQFAGLVASSMIDLKERVEGGCRSPRKRRRARRKAHARS